MLVEFLIGQLFLALFNVGNSRIDAYRILANKNIAHGINFIAYFGFSILLVFLLGIPVKFWLILGLPVPHGPAILFLISAFFNRQFAFDIPLNLRRGLDWFYQTKATGPKASILDRLERFIFGSGDGVGKSIFCFYFGCYAATVASFIIVYG